MVENYEIAQIAHDVIISPGLWSAGAVFVISFLNELLAIIPYHILLTGQLLFLNAPLNFGLFAKILVFVAAPVGVGAALGSILTYGLAYFGGKPAIEKFGKYIRVSWDHVDRVEKHMASAWYDDIVFLFLRSIPLVPSLPVNIAAGIVRMKPGQYLFLTLLGTIIKVMLLFALVALGIISVAE